MVDWVDEVDWVDRMDIDKIHLPDSAHSVHSVHCLEKPNWLQLPNLGSWIFQPIIEERALILDLVHRSLRNIVRGAGSAVRTR